MRIVRFVPIVALLLALAASASVAQNVPPMAKMIAMAQPPTDQQMDEGIDTLDLYTTNLEEQKETYFAIGLGATGSFLFNNFDDLNKQMATTFPGIPEFKSPTFMYGFNVFTGIPWIPGWRVGYFNSIGAKNVEISASVQDPADQTKTVSVKQGVDYSIAISGLHVDYGFILFPRFVVLPGVNLGWGKVAVEQYQSHSDADWKDFTLANDPLNKFARADASFLHVQPTLNVEWMIQQGIMIRLSGGYAMNFETSDWNLNSSSTLKGVPSSVRGNGFNAQMGLFVQLSQMK